MTARPDDTEPLSFGERVRQEDAWLGTEAAAPSPPQPALDIQAGAAGLADEPWVSFINRDYFGLALSGGGVRSATFNLGLLQALAQLNLLQHVHYLSTVSGGGYIGGFLTATQTKLAGDLKQVLGSQPTAENDRRETAPVRHLREFSRFLMPRVGFMQGETWDGIVAVLGGLVPSLLATTAVLAVVCLGWFEVATALVGCAAYKGAIAIAALTGFFQLVAEAQERALGKVGKGGVSMPHYLVFVVTAAATATLSWLVLMHFGEARQCYSKWDCSLQGSWNALCAFCTACAAPDFGPTPISRLMCPAAALGLAAFVLLTIRGVATRFWPANGVVTVSLGLDRATARCIVPALLWLLLAGVWQCATLLGSSKQPNFSIMGTATLGAGSASLFVWIREWLKAPVVPTRGSTLFQKLVVVLKPIMPQVAANIAVLVALVLVARLLQVVAVPAAHPHPGFVAVCLAVILAGTLLLFDPAYVGLHDFYRSRIARCYLGAATASAASFSRATSEQPGDDLTLGQIKAQGHGPLHLVCCAANHLGGDTLSTLYRGARSAVISPLGISVGGLSREDPDLRLSSALTASAAAFNSQMGSISMGLGPAVTFLMCMLNLRLGLWVPHPRKPDRWRKILPGLYFLLETIGYTRADAKSGRLHLSDGGHFENLALYELVRRHCRYIVVSDCGADPEVKFDDVANATRRIREDFGVEIDLDVSPLRPGDGGLARQHAVIGTIHYDGLGGKDKGTILYFKPTLTGDEPTDVTQYHSRNVDFPHESTGDQFYDEAQWESYRRLGEHSAQAALGFLNKRVQEAKTSFVENAFMTAGQLWHPAPPDLKQIFLDLTERCAAIEADIRENAPATLRAEFFPEVAAALGRSALPSAPPDLDEVLKTIQILMLIAQVMEDGWVGAQLDRYWSHPLNDGWMNYFQRWGSTPSFRRWWPILRPIYSDGFREFVKERFDLRLEDATHGGHEGSARLILSLGEPAQLRGLAVEQWTTRYGALDLSGKAALQYHLELGGDVALQPIQVGFLIYREHTDDQRRIAEWDTSALFVPHPLIGAGIIARLLDAVVRHFKHEGFHELRVRLDAGPHGDERRGSRERRRDHANREALTQTINFYKSRFFVYRAEQGAGASPDALVRCLRAK